MKHFQPIPDLHSEPRFLKGRSTFFLKSKRILTACLFTFICSIQAFAQSHPVSGTVVDADGKPLGGASVTM